MTKERDKDLSRGPNPLKEYLKPKAGARVMEPLRRIAKRAFEKPPHLRLTPSDKLVLTDLPVTKGELKMNGRKWVTPKGSCRDFREMVERHLINAVRVLRPENWITASIQQRTIALQALEMRLHKMQGRRHTLHKVHASDEIKGESRTDENTRTISINVKLLKSAKPNDALAALFSEMHLLMQREAVKDPKSFAEHGFKNIQRWAEPNENGVPSLSHLDAAQYAKRQVASSK